MPRAFDVFHGTGVLIKNARDCTAPTLGSLNQIPK